jgi:protein-disulfide isomerase
MAFIGQESVWAGEAAECAGDQGQFWPMHDRILAEQAGSKNGSYSKDSLKRYAAGLGLQAEAFNSCMDTGRYTARVKTETDLGRQKGVQRTPTVFVNGQRIEGSPTFDLVRAAVLGVGR